MGKSSILNAIDPLIRLEVGQVSARLGRGRHTTRHVELLRLRGVLLWPIRPVFHRSTLMIWS